MLRRGHLPIRTCVVCGRKEPKFALLRMALDFEEKKFIVLDRDQCLEGRGAYVCPGCLPRLRFTKRVQKAFRNKAKGLAQDIRQ
ncbi:MAG: YlxR family protein [Deltaproteobacteria bacterium]|nr:YlxR family protein [Deltaproteobacteria bacterium]